MKLRSHLLALVLLALVPMVAFGVIMVVLFHKHERAATERGLRETVRAMADSVDHLVAGSTTSLGVLAQSTHLDRGTLDGFHREARQVMPTQPGWMSVFLADPSGRLLLHTARPFGTNLPSVGGRAWFRRVRDTRQATVGDFVLGPTTGRPTATVAVPVVRGDRLLYLLGVGLDLASVNSVFGGQNLPSTWTAAILDREGIIVARSRDAERFIGQPATEKLKAAAAARAEDRFTDSTRDGIESVGVFSRAPLSGWTVVLALPQRELETAFRRPLFLMIGGGLVLLLAGTGMALLLGRQITGPLERLRTFAQAVERGEAPPGPVTSPVAEIRELAHAMDLAASARRRAEESLRVTLTSIGDAVIATDTDGCVTFMNGVAQTLTGWTQDQALGTPLPRVFTIVNEGTREPVENPVARVLREGVIVGLANHTVLVARDGTERPIDDSGAPIRDSTGALLGVVLVFHDVTERRVHERQRARLFDLEQSARQLAERTTETVRRLQRVSDAVLEHLVLEDLPRRVLPLVADIMHADSAAVLLLNDAGTELAVRAAVGLEREIDLAASVPVGHGFAGRVVSERCPIVIANVEPGDVVSPTLRNQGIRSLLGVPIQTESGLLGVLHVGTRTTRHFTTDDEALLQLVADRIGLAIEHGRLLDAERRARADAEMANRAKDEFLATLSHELRTPLTAILGWTRMLRDGALDERKTQRAIEVIERNARAQTQLINDLLDVSRIITGRLRLEIAPVDVAGIVEAVVDAVRPAAEAKDIGVKAEVAPSLPRISADAGRIQQVLWNVVSNAVKFTPRQGRVEIDAAMRGSEVEIAVTDTGPGIPADVLPFVFDRFRQADSTTTRSHGGLGLGLAIARHLVELHGGTIEARTATGGRGTIVTVRVPVRTIATTDVATAPVADRARADVPPELAGVRVLVVDDEPDARELLTVLFQRAGLVVMAAASAAQAMATFERFRPDVLVSDIAMPEQDGYELIHRVRALGARGQIPAVALTAHARSEDRQRAIANGYQMHLAKPVDPAELIRAVARLVADAR